MKLIDTYSKLKELICELEIDVLAFDFRRTLAIPYLQGNLIPIFQSWGLDQKEAAFMDREIPKQVVDKYKNESQVIDWTLVTLLEARSALARSGKTITDLDLEYAYSFLGQEYVKGVVPIVSDDSLWRFVVESRLWLNQSIIIVDGPLARENETIRRVFPRACAEMLIVTSHDIGVNKFDKIFYHRLSKHLNCSPEKILVIGDRFDKEITPAKKSGCSALLVVDEFSSEIQSDQILNLNFVII